MSQAKTFGYVRVSTQEQNEQMQIDALVAAGVPESAIRIDKTGGGSMDRPALKRIVKMVRAGDTVVVWKLDRLGRSVLGVLDLLAGLEKEGVTVRSLTEQLDTSSPYGRVTMNVLLAMAQLERDLISERTRAGIAAMKARGGRMGQKHRILDYPKRLARFTELWERGLIPGGELTGREIVDEMNAADPSAPQIKGPQSYFNWKSKGFPGFTPPDAEED